ncbi:DNA-binding response OmpR family regulator [Lachnospiraceae bacterium PF1-21]
MKILIVEDERRLAEALAAILKKDHHETDLTYNGEEGLYYAIEEDYDLIILDVMLPKMDGFAVAKALREQKIETPILMLTAKGEIPDKINGLDSGADDYMTKPFDADELRARVRALTRRQGVVIMDTLTYGDVVLNLSTNQLIKGAKNVNLGFKEREVLRLLIASGEMITPKETLLSKVWGDASEAVDNNVEAYISFLRKKLKYLKSTLEIETIRKVGYKLVKKEDKND